MIVQVDLMPCLNVLDPVYKNVNIAKSVSFQENGVELARNTQVMTFLPGQIQETIDWIGNDTDPVIAYLEAIWS